MHEDNESKHLTDKVEACYIKAKAAGKKKPLESAFLVAYVPTTFDRNWRLVVLRASHRCCL